MKLYERILKILIEQDNNPNLLDPTDIKTYLPNYSIADIEIAIRILTKNNLVLYSQGFKEPISIHANNNSFTYFIEKEELKAEKNENRRWNIIQALITTPIGLIIGYILGAIFKRLPW